MSGHVGSSGSKDSPWRRRAAQVVEELFPMVAVADWDDLLELRERLLAGGDWAGVIDHFLKCRRRLERDHYLPFYRLRRLLEGHLRLEVRAGTTSAVQTLRLALWRHRGMADVQRRATWEHWEQAVDRVDPEAVRVSVVEHGISG